MHDLASLLAFIESEPQLRALRDEVAGLLDEDPGHDLAHCLRVALWATRLAEATRPEDAVAAALLHDVVNLPKDSPDRAEASERSAAVARETLPRFGFPAPQVEVIAAAIRDHSYSRGATPTSDLGRALQDADRLEALGALGIFRAVSTGTRMGARYFHASDPWAEDRELDDLSNTVDHFFRKLLALPDSMNTEAGRVEARRRAAYLEGFLRQLGDELGHPPPPARVSPASA